MRAIGPTWSSVHAIGITPRLLTRPYVGFRPTVPQYAAGMRIDPPVSEPSAAGVREALEPGNAAPQDPFVPRSFRAREPESEDCLHLNVYTPALDGARRALIASQVAKTFGREPAFAPYRMGSAFLLP